MAFSINYFQTLASSSINLIDSLPMELTPQPLDYTLIKLTDALKHIRVNQIASFKEIPKENSTKSNQQCTPGLNTIGMLADRFSILIIKEWCIRNKNSDPEKADVLYQTQTTEIMKAMEEVRRGYSSLNSKITNIKANAKAGSWEEAYYGLLTTNLLLWESQEILYIKDIQSLPVEEIRDYIKWFSFGNILRNEYIELCELLYWA